MITISLVHIVFRLIICFCISDSNNISNINNIIFIRFNKFLSALTIFIVHCADSALLTVYIVNECVIIR